MESVGAGVGSFVGRFVGGNEVGLGASFAVGLGVSFAVGSDVKPSFDSQGVFGKQERPSGHSEEDPVGQGLIQFVDAS